MNVGRGDSNHPPDARAGGQASGAGSGCAEAAEDAPHDAHGSEVEPCDRHSSPSEPCDRRSAERIDVTWVVDCEAEDTFLYAAITNISELGIFVRTTTPLPVGSRLTLRFAPPGWTSCFVIKGAVQWINEVHPLRETLNPGMGIRFVDLTLDERERIVEAIRTIAYLRESPVPAN
jgi:type IV pilus assembly protein PilZ